MFLVTLVLGLWLGYQEGPREIARWYLAAAMEHRELAAYHRRHDRSADAERHARAAEAALRKALAWDPASADAYVVRAGWHRQKNELEQALADYDRALALGGNDLAIRERRSVLYMQMKRYREAVEDQLAIYEHVRSQWWLKSAVPEQQNSLAYFRAVGKQDLHQALKEINEVLAGREKTPLKKLTLQQRSELMRWLDTRGYILYLLDRPKEAINDMDQAARLARSELAEMAHPVARQRRLHGTMELRDMQEFEAMEASMYYNYGVIFYHRSLVLEKLKHKKDAAEDRELARSLLGREPDESVF
jgi:tetratricopeptide (TPR) repeat protein